MVDEGAVTVCVRVRPLIARENALEDKASLYWKSEGNTVSEVNGTKVFSYDRVFHSDDNTQQLYEGVAVPIIQSAVQGYNGTIFAYGQTASGKTYTMMGNKDSAGIIPKAIQHVFKIICEIPDREFLLRVSYMEIYNETITDLLCNIRKKKPLGIREDVNRNTYVEDLIEEVVVSPEQVMEWIRKGEKISLLEHKQKYFNIAFLTENRHYGETKMNEHSSRSHTIFRMIIESRERSDPANANCDGAVMVSHLNLVDLAGSERASQTGSEGLRLKEGCNINRSLFILGQVIKKLCDDPSGFINYRDSKLTRILQNSLGGNAKTVIICTITPVSFDETLSTLQFANTAKRMKNTPKVNEVLDDDALLKRCRKEILDLKKQLEEVSLKTQIHAMEKDQLAHLLEEKNSLQKVQEDRIRNLTEMLVTSASFASKENAKTQRDFEESVQLCEALAIEKDIAVNEINVLQANFNKLVLENEQLKSEINEMKEKLKEKMEMDEFEALEKQTQRDHEIQLMHEISNLKNIVSNAEAYNEELEAEIKSKLEQLKEKENKIKMLKNRVEELQKAEVEKKDGTLSVGDTDKLIEEIQQLSKSLLDSETIAMDAKKESAFLRTENLELKERMNELLNNYKQMQKDVQLYRSQIEAGKESYKKMQADLQKELQSAFQENTRLNSLMEGKVPKDLVSLMDLERKASDLKAELEKALEENVFLQTKVNELSELQFLPSTVEMQQREILEKNEELRLLKLEREKLLSASADDEVKLNYLTDEIEKSKKELADAQLKYISSDEEYVALKQLHEELEQKYVAVSENYEQMKLQIERLSKDAEESKTALDYTTSELSNKMKELEEKTAEHEHLLHVKEELAQAHQKLNEMEQLKEQEKIMEARLETKDSEIQAVLQQLSGCWEEIKTLTQERDHLKQKEESLQAETDQLKEDIKDTVSMNILAHEELRNAQSSLQKSQETVKKLEKSISEKETQILSVEETLGRTINELKIQLSQMTEELKSVVSERDWLAAENKTHRESGQLQVLKEQILSLTQEKNSLQDKLDSLHLKKVEYGEETLVPVIQEKSVEQELLHLREELSQTQKKLNAMEEMKASEFNRESENVEQTDLIPKLHDCQEMGTMTEKDDFKMQLENLQNERDHLKHAVQEAISLNSEVQEELRCAHNSIRQHQETIVELKESISEKESLLLKAQEALKETTELKQKLSEVSENLTHISSEYGKLLAEKEQIETTMNEGISQQLEKIALLNVEKDELQRMVEVSKTEKDQLKADCQESKKKLLEVLTEMEDLQKELKHQKEQADIQKNMLAEREEKLQNTEEKLTEEVNKLNEKAIDLMIFKLSEDLNVVTKERQQILGELKEKSEYENSKLQQLEKQCDLLVQERDQFQEMLQHIQAEKNKLEVNLQESINKILETERELKCQQELLSHEKMKAEEREEHLLKVQRRSEVLEDSLTNKCIETSAKLECALDKLKQRDLNDMSVQVNSLDNMEQMDDDSLEAKALKIKELLEIFPDMGKRYECLSTMSLNLKTELNSQKALIAAILTQLSSEQSKQVKRLQMENEKINGHLQSLLNKLKFLFSRVCSKKKEYHATVNKYVMELFEEKKKQEQLQVQIQCLKKFHLNQDDRPQELSVSEVWQHLHLNTQTILKDISEMESELLSIEAELQQEASTRKETSRFWETCSGHHCDAEELKEELKKDNERLLQVINFWTPKVKMLLQLSSELDDRTLKYCKNADVEWKQRKEKSEELLQNLKTLKEQLAPDGSANLLEEENYKLHTELKAAKQDIKALEAQIQKLENSVNEAGKNLREKDDRINKLQAQIRITTVTSELTQLQSKLNETEKSLRTSLKENQSLQAKLDKGAELYKEEIDQLKTQLVKCDMERMKQSSSFDMKLANYKALAEHQEEQLRKLKEELRRAQQEQDVTVMSEKEAPQQSQMPFTCGGGSGIVQSTQILVLKSEQVKLQKENLHLKKQNDILLSNELQLKEELRKWKERALKLKERFSRETTQEAVPRSPRKTVLCPLKVPSSPSKESVSQETVTQYASKPLPLTCPTNFFDNSNLDTLIDTQPAGIEPTEDHLKKWFGTSEKDKVSDCTTQ
ncbi:hypothetical protein ASZ78_013121 [Callipepla squamata]|uniref:Centromere-associated protein E n=1 Tax=Callipepla squamata TaxID=9009 RepID=A0A226MN08_CALSU|nr:hypothetical protein ASZ78_013121 [Callipepla squamata]